MSIDYASESIILHRENLGKIEVASKVPLESLKDLSLAYTPGVAAPCEEIRDDVQKAYDLTIKGNSVAVVTDGSAVLGLGNIGPEAALPVMEGKALLLKRYANIDAWPICLDTQDPKEIIHLVKMMAPGFGAINLEDISAPRCFEIEEALQDIGIPVFHDDQHGTAVVVLASLINAQKLTQKPFDETTIVINGSGSAGVAIVKLLQSYTNFKDIIICDSKGVISSHRTGLTPTKKDLLERTNNQDLEGSVYDALKGADIFIGVSKGNLLKKEHVQSMAPNPIILALANPVPEIWPEEALQAGAFIVGTGRSDLPNQVNNALAFPGIFRGALNAHAKKITHSMKIAAAEALASVVESPTKEKILPSTFEPGLAYTIAEEVEKAYNLSTEKTQV